jgi:hypothetical protein
MVINHFSSVNERYTSVASDKLDIAVSISVIRNEHSLHYHVCCFAYHLLAETLGL